MSRPQRKGARKRYVEVEEGSDDDYVPMADEAEMDEDDADDDDMESEFEERPAPVKAGAKKGHVRAASKGVLSGGGRRKKGKPERRARGGGGDQGEVEVDEAMIKKVLSKATRADLERIIHEQFVNNTLYSLRDIQARVDPSLLLPPPEFVESDANLGACDGLSRELLFSVMHYLGTRDRFKCAERVCKTWSTWLAGQPVVYGHIEANLSRHSSDMTWINGPGLLSMVSMAPPGSIKTFMLSADDKQKFSSLHKTKHTQRIFKMASQLSDLRRLKLTGGKLCGDALALVAENCSRNLEDLSLSDAMADFMSVKRLLSNAPYIRHLTIPSLNKEAMDDVLVAIQSARQGGPPLLEKLECSGSSYLYGCSSETTLDQAMRLFLSFPALKHLQLGRIRLPPTVEEMEQMFMALPTALPHVTHLRTGLTIARTSTLPTTNHNPSLLLYGSSLREEHSEVLSAFLARLESVFPNLQMLGLSTNRGYLSVKDQRQGRRLDNPATISGTFHWPKLTDLSFSEFNLSNHSFAIHAPKLHTIHVRAVDRGTQAVVDRLKGTTCPKLSKVFVSQAQY